MLILQHENHPSLTAMSVYMFDISEVVVDPKSTVPSRPFKHHLTGRKDDTNSNQPSTADPTLVLITQQFKDPWGGYAA
jgi:hypothetical protein